MEIRKQKKRDEIKEKKMHGVRVADEWEWNNKKIAKSETLSKQVNDEHMQA